MSPAHTSRSRAPEPGHARFNLVNVARLTGLTPDLIRAWERRYGAVHPVRGPRGARLYSAADVERLQLLAAVVGSGRAIGDVARLPNEELATILQVDASPIKPPVPAALPLGSPLSSSPEQSAVRLKLANEVLEAVRRFDREAIERLLGDALLAFGASPLAEEILTPLLHEVGERWMRGALTVAHEHFLSAILRDLLAGILWNRRHAASEPRILLATPEGELHEFGLLLAALVLADSGFNVCYLGASVPAADLCSAAEQASVRAVGLSVVNAANRARAVQAIEALANLRKDAAKIPLWIGGQDGAATVRSTDDAEHVVLIPDLRTLTQRVAQLRAGRSKARRA
ncbi:MAG: MerR family transcriptional regulator [Candidatus Binatia bacterium]|nr:MerR family transcriptional regulator [Candidatus Binatia bacterium]